MEEHQSTLPNNSSDSASDDLSNSLLGKMKCSVSKILPTTISKWLSPNVDTQNNRRRRYDELDSEEDDTYRNQPTAHGNVPVLQRAATTGAIAPPTKRQRIITPNPWFNTQMTSVPRRGSIISSTLIEDSASTTPYRPRENGTELSRRSLERSLVLDNNNQYERASPLATASALAEKRSSTTDLSLPQTRSQPTTLSTYRPERDLDETSSNRSTNPFALRTDPMAVNFSAHLQKSKSLFSNKSYVSPSSRSLSNYRMRRQPNSSMYRSTSSLCDNNSNASSNASSALSSPFYNGQTTFGGASAQSKRFASGYPMHHRPKIPSRLVPSNLSKSTSSLNVTGDHRTTTMSGLSATTQRILDVINQSTTPLTDVRRQSNALPTAATKLLDRRLSSLLEMPEESRDGNLDKSKVKLLKPNTPYNRPVGRSLTEPCFTQGLNVPSMPQLLQLKKKLTDNMVRGRALASQSNSILNTVQSNNYKLPESVTATTDLDATNNNHMSSTVTNKQVTKIRNNIATKHRKTGKEQDILPEPVDLPNVQLQLNNANIQLPAMSFPVPKTPQIDMRKIDEPITNSKQIQASAPTTTITFNFTPAPAPKYTSTSNHNLFPSTSTSTSTFTTKPSSTFGATKGMSAGTTVGIASVDISRSASFEFAAPIYVKSSAQNAETDSSNVQEKQIYKFSEPILIDLSSSTAAPTLNSSPSKFAPIESNKAKQVPSPVSAKSLDKCDDTLKALAGKQMHNKWTCSSCFTPNENIATKCVCCGVSHTTSTTASAPQSFSSSSAATAAVDDVFKSIVAKQKQSKWKCDTCMADNEITQIKCLCCGESKPGSNVSVVSAAVPSTNAKADDLFKTIAAKQKSQTWTCSVCDTKNGLNKSKCVCCQQAKPSDATATSNGTLTSTSTPKFTFGSGGIDLGMPSGKFTFGSKPSSDSSATTATSNATTTASAAATFTFGVAKPVDSFKSTASANTFGSFTATTSMATSAASPTAKFSFGSPALETKPAVPLGTFAFGGGAPKTDSAPLTTASTGSTSFTFGTSKPALSIAGDKKIDVSGTTAPATDDVFKKIVSQQTAKWSCDSCMAQNNQNDSNCVCCSTPRDGSSASEKTMNSVSKPKISFGTPSTSSFSFGSQPSSTASTCFQLRTVPTTSTPSIAASSAPGTFSLSSTQPTISSPFTLQKSTPDSSAMTSFAATTETKQFQFGSSAPTFGSSAPTFGSSAPTFGSPRFGSIDVTDAPKSSPSNALNENKSVVVVENVQIKPPATTTVEQSKPVFSFGTSNAIESKSIAIKRPSTDVSSEPNFFKMPTPAPSVPAASSFVFGQPDSAANTLSSSLATNPQSNSTTSSTAPAPAFSFGSAATPSFNFSSAAPAASFQFGASSPSMNPAPAVPVFGSSTFPLTTPTAATTTPQSAFPTNTFSFGGSSAAPAAFGIPQPAQTQPGAGAFQFGSNTNQSVAPAPASAAFRFDASVAPTFNFSAAPQPQSQPQPQAAGDSSAPFQFSQTVPTNNMFAVQSQTPSTTAIRDRRKLTCRSRRVNRT